MLFLNNNFLFHLRDFSLVEVTVESLVNVVSLLFCFLVADFLQAAFTAECYPSQKRAIECSA